MCGMSRALIGWQVSCPYDYIYKQSNVSVQASVIWAMKWYDKYPDVLNNNVGTKLQTKTKFVIGKNAVIFLNVYKALVGIDGDYTYIWQLSFDTFISVYPIVMLTEFCLALLCCVWIQHGAVITRSIFSKIVTIDTP